MRIAIVFYLLCICTVNTTNAQKTLTATPIDTWPRESKVTVPLTYNRVSSYLYIINAKKYLDLFDGASYTREERNRLQIKPNDKPNFLQMSISITDRNISEHPLTVPLLLVDIRDQANFKAFESFKGPILDNLNVNDIDSDIMGSIEVNAMISNASAKFWSEVAKIAADLGKSAVAIAMSNPKGATDLTTKLTGYIEKGIAKLETLSDGEKVESFKFFITLVERPDDTAVEEVVTSVRAYQIHWFGEPTQKSNFFEQVGITDKLAPSAFEGKILTKDIPIVLVIETRSRTKIDVGEPVFTEDYSKFAMNEYKGYPIEDQPLLKSYYVNFSYAFSAFNYLKIYNSSVNGLNTDWNSLLYAIDNTYQYRINVKKETVKYTTDAYALYKKRFEAVSQRYEIINHQLNDVYRNIERKNAQLEKANTLLYALLNPISIAAPADKAKLYREIEKLSIYDTWISNTSADGSTLKSSPSYQKSKELKKEYEKALIESLKQNIPNTNELKLKFYTDIRSQYELCSACVSEASAKIAAINQETLTSLINSYTELKKSQFNDFNDCSVFIISNMTAMKTKIASSPELTQKLASASLLELEGNLKVWSDNITRDTTNATIEQLGVWTAAIADSRAKMKADLTDLIEKKILANESLPCPISH